MRLAIAYKKSYWNAGSCMACEKTLILPWIAYKRVITYSAAKTLSVSGVVVTSLSMATTEAAIETAFALCKFDYISIRSFVACYTIIVYEFRQDEASVANAAKSLLQFWDMNAR